MLGTVAEYAAYVLTAGLVAVAAMLLYPVVRYAQNVQHRRGLVFLSLAFGSLVVANTVSFVVEIPYGWGQLFSMFAAVLVTIGLYDFARPFLQTGTTDGSWDAADEPFPSDEGASGADPDADDTTGGFETATDGTWRSRTDGGEDDAAQ